jgi:hypothetical protein
MEHTLRYDSPEISDLGTLLELTLASGVLGSEDGTGKTVQGGVDDVVEVSIGVLP